MSVSWLSEEQAQDFERAALASWEHEYAIPDAPDSHPCAQCGDPADPEEVQVSATRWVHLCGACRRDVIESFREKVAW